MSERLVQIANQVEDDLVEEIEALGAMSPAVDQARSLVKSYDARVKSLQQRLAADAPRDMRRLAMGREYMADIAPAKTVRQIKNLPLLIELLTPEVFLQLAKVNITDIEKYVPEYRLDEVLEKVPTDSRAIKIVKRA